MISRLSLSFFSFILTALISWLAVWSILPHLRKRLLDTPNQRSSHQLPTPRGGGIAFVLVGSLFHWLASADTIRWIPILCLPVAIIGLIDDRNHVPAFWRYLIHLGTAFILVLLAKISIPLWAIPLCIILITAVINFMNFMDGLDGLLAGCSVVLMASASAWCISGSIFGFLLWNWSPAKVFMGDVGSTYIGAVFTGLLLQQATPDISLTLLLFCFPLLADPATCIVRRFWNQKDIFTAHRQHLYQRLNQAGWNHAWIATTYILAVIVLVVVHAIGGLPWLAAGIFAEFLLALILEGSVATKFIDS